MRVELVCTGDELVTGAVTDTNSPYLEARLYALGARVVRVQVVGDVRADIVHALREAAARADVVVVSGGLGPTADDITVECAADVAGLPLGEHGPTLAALQERFARRGLAFTANNARQARVPQGAEVVPNPVGTAPMLVLQVGEAQVYLLAGVPSEFRALVDAEVLPRLAAALARAPGRTWRAVRLLRCMGLPESHLDARVAPLAAQHPRVTFGFRTEAPENHLRLVAEAPSQPEADAALAAAEAACRAVLGTHVYGADACTYPEALAALLRGAHATLAVAEGCSGGLVSEWLSGTAGACDVFLGGQVACHEGAPGAGLPEGLLARHGAASAEVAGALAEGVRRAWGTTWGLSTTLCAPVPGEPPLLALHCALASAAGTARCERFVLPAGRARLRLWAASAALELLRHHLLATPRA